VQGTDSGFIKFGSRVDVYFPLDANIKVELNQKLKGGESILATF
jgi:phosphatidylserine decarboxylase